MRFLAMAAVLPTLIMPTAQGPQRSDVSTTLPAEPVEVPMRMVNRRPMVDVRINGGGPYSFLIDTGGSGLARADKSLVDKLKLEVVGEARGAAGTGGQVVSMPIVRYSTLEIGGAVFKNVDAPSRDYNEGLDTRIDGVLGIGLFSTCLVTLDYSQRQRAPAPGATPTLTRLVSPFAGGDDISNCLHHDAWRFQVHVVSGVHDTLRAC